jgi:hypothetical protein
MLFFHRAGLKTVKSPDSAMQRILVCLILLLLSPAQPAAVPKSERELARIADKLTETSTAYGSIPSLYRPRYLRVIDAALSLGKDEVVFVARLPGGVRIYPQRIMVWHEVINELIDDHAYAVTYCPISGSLAVYDAALGGVNLIFDAEGRLFEGNTVLIDRNSGSLWIQMMGMAFDGPLRGRGMPILPVFWTTWGYASRFFPDAVVLAQPLEFKKPYGRDPYGNYQSRDSYYQNDILVYPVSRMDRRFPRKTPVLGLEHNGLFMGINIDYVKKNGAVNFFMGDAALLAVHDPRLDVVRVFDRRVWDKPALFVKQNGRLMDLGSRTFWDDEGKAVRGNMEGASMKELFGIYAMWFAWFAMNPETLVLPGPGEVDGALLSSTPPE